MTKYFLLFLIVLINIFVVSSFLNYSLAQETLPQAPGTFEEAGDFVIKILKGISEGFKSAFKEALVIWRKMGDRAKDLWNSSVQSRLRSIWRKITTFFGKEIEKRKPMIEEELKKEKKEIKEEVKTEVPKVGKSLWERFKELIK